MKKNIAPSVLRVENTESKIAKLANQREGSIGDFCFITLINI